MSKTLFWYIFKDLLRIFVLTAGALAGIMSFGGLLRPLTEHGLDAGQAAKMLSYFMPAMTTYSLPIAALFATTVVYGRLAADNEITAMRAAGISYFVTAVPAIWLGLIVTFSSLILLCFIVPIFTLRVEQVIYSNLAQLISNQIERTHQIKFADTTIFAQEAAVGEDDPKHPDEQTVSLGGLMLVSYRKVDSVVPNTPQVQVPREFYLAKQATVFIRRTRGDEYTLEAKLEEPGGAMFPRTFGGASGGGGGNQGGVMTTSYGPFVIDSLIREETKFMDIRRLHELYLDLGKSRRVQDQVQRIVRTAQEQAYLGQIAKALSVAGGSFHFDAGQRDYDVVAKERNGISVRNERLVIAPARLLESTKGEDKSGHFTWDAAEIELSAKPIGDDQFSVEAQMRGVVADTPEGPTKKTSFARSFVVPIPAQLRALANREVSFYETATGVPRDQRNALTRERYKLENGIQSELQSRCSFALSCLFLVVVGCCLGMMFKSGNYLTAFAISVVPALACISLIIAGQHTCENVPWKLENFQNPINLGLGLIWAGPAVVLALAVVLGGRLMRQ